MAFDLTLMREIPLRPSRQDLHLERLADVADALWPWQGDQCLLVLRKPGVSGIRRDEPAQ